ncbi:MAG: hypothetical protein Q8Q95_02175 [bacterium]|nr:hypothetical protein [bacterium]
METMWLVMLAIILVMLIVVGIKAFGVNTREVLGVVPEVYESPNDKALADVNRRLHGMCLVRINFAGKAMTGKFVDGRGKRVKVAIDLNGRQHLVRRKTHQMEWVR